MCGQGKLILYLSFLVQVYKAILET